MEMSRQEPALPNEPVARERRSARLFAVTFVLSAGSGFVTWFYPGFTVWLQWTWIVHMVAGGLFSVALLVYLIRHFRRVVGVRRPLTLLLGLLAASVFLALAGLGIALGLNGVTESTRWVKDTHAYLACAAVVLLIVHMVVHALTWRAQNRPVADMVFRTVDAGTVQVSLLTLMVATALVAGASIAYVQLYEVDAAAAEAVTPYAFPYGEHPFRPSQTETETGGFVAVAEIGRSDRCGTCHREIFAQWRASMHAQAANDATYVRNINLLESKRGIVATRYCEGCHAPVALLTGQLSPGGKHGGVPGVPANLEGVGCLGCHGISEAVHLKGVASYRFSPPEQYLFWNSSSALGRRVHNLLLRVQPDQHRDDMARTILRRPEHCATCHAQFMDRDMNDWGWVKMQDEYSAWLQGPYSGQSQHSFSVDKSVRCQDCHFPLVDAVDPSADTHGQVRSHYSLGANTAIPWIVGDAAQVARTADFLRAGKVRLTIEIPERADAVRSTRPIELPVQRAEQTPVYLYLGERMPLQVTVTNALVGHDFPGGTTDINEAWLWIRVVDATDALVYESGSIAAPDTGAGAVDPAAHFYRSVPVDRQGRHVWKHDLFNMVGDSYKKVIPAGAADIVSYAFNVPYWAKGPLVVSAVLRYRKFNAQYANWALGPERARNIPVVDVARDSLLVPVRERPATRTRE